MKKAKIKERKTAKSAALYPVTVSIITEPDEAHSRGQLHQLAALIK